MKGKFLYLTLKVAESSRLFTENFPNLTFIALFNDW